MATIALVFVALTYLLPLSVCGDSLNKILFDGSYEFIDLTHPFDNQTIYWPGTQPFRFTKKIEDYQLDLSWYAANEFAAGEHGGTHIDAPYHFFASGQHVGDLPLEKLIVPLIIIDISSKVNDNPDFVLYKHDLDYMINDNMGKPCILIFKFGWSKYFYDSKKYLGMDKNTDTLRFPGLSAEVMEWITTAYKNVVGIGVDVASIDPGNSKDFPAHKLAAKSGLYNIENVNLNLARPISEYKCTALVLPMKIGFGTGAPLRLVAICPKELPRSF